MRRSLFAWSLALLGLAACGYTPDEGFGEGGDPAPDAGGDDGGGAADGEPTSEDGSPHDDAPPGDATAEPGDPWDGASADAGDDGAPGPCTAGAVDTRACGKCGSESRSCGSGGVWNAWSGCGGEGECSPGATDSAPCGVGGTQTRTCSAFCAWEPYGICVGATDCAPGTSESQPCGKCGTRTRTCSGAGTWSAFGMCGSEGECAAGATRSQVCELVGSQTSTCDAACHWGSWGSCNGANPTPQSGGNGTFVFPKTGDLSKPASSSTGYSMTNVGSYAIGARTTTLASATSFTSTVEYNNYLANSGTCTVHYDIYLNGTKIGSAGAGNQQKSSAVSLTFAPIAGPLYEILYVTTASPTESGCGALYLKKDVSSVTLQ